MSTINKKLRIRRLIVVFLLISLISYIISTQIEDEPPQIPDQPEPPPSPTSYETLQFVLEVDKISDLSIAKPACKSQLSITKVELSPDALVWANPSNSLRQGDVFVVQVRADLIYELTVQSVEFDENLQSCIVTANASIADKMIVANIQVIEGQLRLEIKDLHREREFILHYNAIENSYVIEEINPALIPILEF